MDIFLKRVAPPQSEPLAGPSGAAPGEGGVVTGCDPSIAPEDPPVGPDEEVGEGY